jgi:phage tail protein X
MLLSKSRYKDSRLFEATSTSSFAGLRPRDIATATGVIEHVLQEGDRLDHLARQYFNNDRLWWRIIDANPQLYDATPFLPISQAITLDDASALLIGTVIVIPRVRE